MAQQIAPTQVQIGNKIRQVVMDSSGTWYTTEGTVTSIRSSDDEFVFKLITDDGVDTAINVYADDCNETHISRAHGKTVGHTLELI